MPDNGEFCSLGFDGEKDPASATDGLRLDDVTGDGRSPSSDTSRGPIEAD